jgi:hypothetical protein
MINNFFMSSAEGLKHRRELGDDPSVKKKAE